MPIDSFFIQPNCDRCHNDLSKHGVRKMSWFNNHTLCHNCIDEETKLKADLREANMDVSALEGCGYIPKIPQ